MCGSMYSPVVARQRLGRNVTAVANSHATIEELLDASSSMWSVSYQGKEAISSSQNFLLFLLSFLCVFLCCYTSCLFFFVSSLLRVVLLTPLLVGWFLNLLFDPEDGSSTFLTSVSFYRSTRRYVSEDNTLLLLSAPGSQTPLSVTLSLQDGFRGSDYEPNAPTLDSF
jgi:hypothetical protein